MLEARLWGRFENPFFYKDHKGHLIIGKYECKFVYVAENECMIAWEFMTCIQLNESLDFSQVCLEKRGLFGRGDIIFWKRITLFLNLSDQEMFLGEKVNGCNHSDQQYLKYTMVVTDIKQR